MKPSILIIYTGGTIGMKPDPTTGALVPFDFSGIFEEFPTLQSLNIGIEVFTMDPVIDSSNVSPRNWLDLAAIIRDNYARYDGFVVLHGTDTMSYTASALSFLLENLAKPVVFTGSQIPIGVLRTRLWNSGELNPIRPSKRCVRLSNWVSRKKWTSCWP